MSYKDDFDTPPVTEDPQPKVPSIVEKPKEDELPAPIPSTKELYLLENKR